ncbi:DUF721 domain-containing protein [Celeribacter marinus]|uniref:DUF721 domain-containing protein n=1 Tax=Celeribacter marinus TaxID=1397108 RepID=UPI003F6CC91A
MAVTPEKKIARRRKGFEITSGLLQARIRSATETRGFSETRLLTHWPEVVGEQTAAMARPIKVSYAKGAFGATLTLLTTGAFAPMLQADLPKIRDRVNSVYGFNAINRIHITQTAPTGFTEGRVQFETAKKETKPALDPALVHEAHEISTGVNDEGLRAALDRLGANVLTKNANQSKVDP